MLGVLWPCLVSMAVLGVLLSHQGSCPCHPLAPPLLHPSATCQHTRSAEQCRSPLPAPRRGPRCGPGHVSAGGGVAFWRCRGTHCARGGGAGPRSPLPCRSWRKRPLPAPAAQWRHDGQPAGRATGRCPLLRPRPLLPPAQRCARGQHWHRAGQVGAWGGWGAMGGWTRWGGRMSGVDGQGTGTWCARVCRGCQLPLLAWPPPAWPCCGLWGRSRVAGAHRDVSPPEMYPHRGGVCSSLGQDAAPIDSRARTYLPTVPLGITPGLSAPWRDPGNPTVVSPDPWQPVGCTGTHRGVLGQIRHLGTCGDIWGCMGRGHVGSSRNGGRAVWGHQRGPGQDGRCIPLLGGREPALTHGHCSHSHRRKRPRNAPRPPSPPSTQPHGAQPGFGVQGGPQSPRCVPPAPRHDSMSPVPHRASCPPLPAPNAAGVPLLEPPELVQGVCVCFPRDPQQCSMSGAGWVALQCPGRAQGCVLPTQLGSPPPSGAPPLRPAEELGDGEHRLRHPLRPGTAGGGLGGQGWGRGNGGTGMGEHEDGDMRLGDAGLGDTGRGVQGWVAPWQPPR